MSLMKNNIVRISIITLITILSAFFVISIITGGGNRIRSGVKVEGISLSGHTKQKAIEKLAIFSKKIDNAKIFFTYQGKTWEVSYKDIKVKYDILSAVENAFKIGRSKNIFKNFYEALTTMIYGYNIKIGFSYDKNKLNKQLQNIEKAVTTSPRNALLIIEKEKLKIIPEQPGNKLDYNTTIQLVEKHIGSLEEKNFITLPIIQVTPKYTAEHLKLIDSEIGRGETLFNPNETNRVSNIKNALRKINGTILLPGEIFSLNNTLGPRNEIHGYKSAPVIINNELVPGVGGGVCQVATTLYKSILQACLEIIERKHHTFPPAYTQIGQDATIAGNYIDFKFKNSRPHPVCIFAEALYNKIIIRIFSKKDSPNKKVKIESQILAVEDPPPDTIITDDNLAKGTVKTERISRKGYKVAVYRNIYEGNTLIKRELISIDEYKPIRGIVKIGIGITQPTTETLFQEKNEFPQINQDIKN